jgi:hypothetical protein
MFYVRPVFLPSFHGLEFLHPMLKSGVISLLGKVGKFPHDRGVLSFLGFHQDEEDSTPNMSVRVNLS